MARGPYQGLYQSGIRPTIVTAPDALVYINGELTVQGCPACQKRFDLGRYITAIQVDLTVDSPPGSATISLSLPRHTIDNFFFEGTPIISPMMEVEIYAKGYYVLEGLPQYYPIFWGLTTEVGDSYSGGEHTVSIHCEGILKWWDLCKMNINPALTQQTGQMGRSIYGNVLYGSNPFDLIWTLAMQSMGDIVVGSGSLVSMYREATQTKVFTTVMADIMRYWNYRFSKIRSNLLLYGSQGVAVRGDSLYSLYQERKGNISPNFASKAVRTANGGDVGRQFAFDPTDPNVTAYRTQFQQAGQVNFFQSEFQTKLEIANTCKDAIGYEFYMDVTGDIVFKPPFYNLDILSNKPISWIQDIDIIDWDLSESESEVVTQLQLQGSYGGNVDYGFPEEATPYTSVTDYHLLRKYGWRTQTFNSEFLGSPLLMFYAGMDMLDRMNAKRHRGTVSIPLRPELRLGFPIYLAPKDQIWYVNGISHNIQFGGRAQTSLTLTAKREKFLAPKGIGRLSMINYVGQKKEAIPPSTNPPAGASGGGAPTDSTVTPKANVSAQYTSRQLSVGATFKLEASNPTGIAQMPFLPVSEKTVPNDDPYRPVILRHPKTGRVMGWPNVVIAYTRPLLPSDNAVIAANSGVKTGNLKKGEDLEAKARKEINATGPGTIKSIENAVAALDQDKAYEKHMSHRYSYGITSAGVYVYAHDTSKKINEMAILPAEKLQVVTAEGQAAPKFAKSVMIRPVSDDRGFEVIGHHSYGRGVSLRDGSLVLQQGGKNQRTEIGVQLALTGDMTASLLAQSQGITTTVTGYANPASVVAKLQPEDLETAAVVNPETQKTEYDTTKQNFIDTSPVGSPENKGLPSSVEASQLSRALSLAEMRVRETYTKPEDDSCSCLTGRSDLAFMSFGYQIKPLSLDPMNLAPFDTSLGSSSELQQAMADAVGLRPYTHNGIMGRVTKFLTDLYNMLDGDHQELEKVLRGSLTVRDSSGVNNRSSVATEPSSLEPPYSAENRAAIGDPNATLRQYDSASKEISNQWKKFGDDIKKNSQKAKLQQEVANLQSDITRLRSDAEKTQQKVQTGRATQADVDAIQKTIADKNRQIQNKQLELSGLG